MDHVPVAVGRHVRVPQNLEHQCRELGVPFLEDMPPRFGGSSFPAHINAARDPPCALGRRSDQVDKQYNVVLDAVFGFRFDVCAHTHCGLR